MIKNGSIKIKEENKSPLKKTKPSQKNKSGETPLSKKALQSNRIYKLLRETKPSRTQVEVPQNGTSESEGLDISKEQKSSSSKSEGSEHLKKRKKLKKQKKKSPTSMESSEEDSNRMQYPVEDSIGQGRVIFSWVIDPVSPEDFFR